MIDNFLQVRQPIELDPLIHGSELTLEDYVEQLFKSQTEASIQEALTLMPTNDPKILGAIADQLLEIAEEDSASAVWALEFATGLATRIGINDSRHHTIANVRNAEIEKRLESGTFQDVQDALRLMAFAPEPDLQGVIDRCTDLSGKPNHEWAADVANLLNRLLVAKNGIEAASNDDDQANPASKF